MVLYLKTQTNKSNSVGVCCALHSKRGTVDVLRRIRPDSLQPGQALRNWAEPREFVSPQLPPPRWGSESWEGGGEPASKSGWAGGSTTPSLKAGSLISRGSEFCIRPLAKGIRNWVARTAVSELWKQGPHGVQVLKCRQGLSRSPCETVWMNRSLVMCWCFWVCDPRGSQEFASYADGNWQRLLVLRMPPFRKVGGWKTGWRKRTEAWESPLFWPASATQAAAVLTAVEVCGRMGRGWLIFCPSSRRLQRCLREITFHFWQNLVKGHKSNSFLLGSFWKGEIQNVPTHLL